MASEREEVFWALANINSIMNAVIDANKKAGVAAAHQIERDWITVYSVTAAMFDQPEESDDAKAQALVDYTLEMLNIPKSP